MTEKNKYRFKGHESFILREGWLNKGLFEIEKDAKVFSEIMERMNWELDLIWQNRSATGLKR